MHNEGFHTFFVTSQSVLNVNMQKSLHICIYESVREVNDWHYKFVYSQVHFFVLLFSGGRVESHTW